LTPQHALVDDPRQHSKLAVLLSLWWMISIVDSALPQMQIALFGGRVPIPNWLFDGLFLVFAASFALRRVASITLPAGLLASTTAFAVYLALELIFLTARTDTTALRLITDYYRYYFFLLILPLAFAVEGTIDPDRLLRWTLWAFVPLAAIGIQQYFGGDPILPTESTDGRWQIYAWARMGEVRAFSLFNSGWSFGHYAALAGSCAYFTARNPANGAGLRTLSWGLVLASLVCAYASQTRTVLLVTFATASAVVVIEYARRRDDMTPAILLPVGAALLGFLVANGANWIVQLLDLRDASLFATGSIDARWASWTLYGGRWLGGSWTELLFGLAIGQQQSGMAYSESTVLIDNMVVAIGVQAGLVGVLLWAVMMWKIWRMVLANAQHLDHPLHWGLAAIWAAWPLSLMFCASTVFYGLLAIVSVLSHTVAAPSGQVAEVLAATPRLIRNSSVRALSRR
jgi:hypothetical protein